MAVTQRRLAQLVKEDRAIETSADSATLALMQHRWKAVQEVGSVSQYARALGKAASGVSAYVRAYEMVTKNSLPSRSPGEILQLAQMGEDKRIAAEAVADAQHVTVNTVRQHHGTDLRRVERAVKEAPPERRQEVATRMARQIESTRQQTRADTEHRRAVVDRAYLDLERELDKGRRSLTQALAIAREANLDGEWVTLAKDSLDKIRALINLVELAITGAVSVDWDAELSKLAG